MSFTRVVDSMSLQAYQTNEEWPLVTHPCTRQCSEPRTPECQALPRDLLSGSADGLTLGEWRRISRVQRISTLGSAEHLGVPSTRECRALWSSEHSGVLSTRECRAFGSAVHSGVKSLGVTSLENAEHSGMPCTREWSHSEVPCTRECSEPSTLGYS